MIATALLGMPSLPAIWMVLGTLAVNGPVVPRFTRESSSRTGVIGLNVAPAVWSSLTFVLHPPGEAVYWLPCQTAFVSRGSWATPTKSPQRLPV